MDSQQSSGFVQAIQLGKQVTTSEGPLVILDDINFSIAAGTSVAILGASGSGKTTLLGLLAGLDVSSTGQALINDIELGSLDEDGRALLRADTVGFVFQSFNHVQFIIRHFPPLVLCFRESIAYFDQLKLNHLNKGVF